MVVAREYMSAKHLIIENKKHLDFTISVYLQRVSGKSQIQSYYKYSQTTGI